MMGGKIFSSQKGKPKLAANGYTYRQSSVNMTSVNWRCDQAKCKGSVSTPAMYDVPDVEVRTLQPHSHAPQPETVEVAVAKDAMLHQAGTSQEPPRRVISDTMTGLSDGALVRLGKRSALRKQIQRKRLKVHGGVPLNPADRNFELPNIYKVVKEGEQEVQFVLHDSLPPEQEDDDDYAEQVEQRFIIFGTNTMIQIMKNASEWMTDATFKICPTLFFQVLVVHAIFHGHVFPCMYVIMPDKDQQTYEQIFAVVKDLIDGVAPTTVIADFELGLQNALTSTWPNAEIRGCFFHLSQSIWRKAQSLGLSHAYINNERTRNEVKILAALAFLPPDEVGRVFDDLFESASDEVEELYQYYQMNYVGRKPNRGPRRQPRFKIDMWNVRARTTAGIPRTNNKLEGYHSGMQTMFDGVRPTLGRFLKGLQKEHSLQYGLYIQALAGDAPPPQKRVYENINKRLVTVISRHQQGEMTAENFLRAVALNLNLSV